MKISELKINDKIRRPSNVPMCYKSEGYAIITNLCASSSVVSYKIKTDYGLYENGCNINEVELIKQETI